MFFRLLYIRVFHRTSAKDAYLLFSIIKDMTGRSSLVNVQQLIKKYVAQTRDLGFSVPKPVYPHMFCGIRKRICIRRGIAIEPVSAVLGHTWTDTTKNYYTRPSVALLNLCPPKTSGKELLWGRSEEEGAGFASWDNHNAIYTVIRIFIDFTLLSVFQNSILLYIGKALFILISNAWLG